MIVPEGLAGDSFEGPDGQETFGGVVAVEAFDKGGDGGVVGVSSGVDDGAEADGGVR